MTPVEAATIMRGCGYTLYWVPNLHIEGIEAVLTDEVKCAFVREGLLPDDLEEAIESLVEMCVEDALEAAR